MCMCVGSVSGWTQIIRSDWASVTLLGELLLPSQTLYTSLENERLKH